MTATFDRAEWLEWRRGGIGSSDISAVIGLNPWATRYSIWADKTGRTPIDDNDNEVLEFGRRAEAMIGPWFTELTGLLCRKWQHRAQHRTWKPGRATLDALVYRTRRSAAPTGLLEMKTTGWQKDWDEIPAQYDAQIQWQLEVTDLDRAWLAALHGRRLQIYPIERRGEDGAWLLEQARQFWADHVIADIAPNVDGHWATTAALAGLRRTDAAETDITDLLDTIRRYKHAQAEASAAKKHADQLANEIKAALGDGEIGTVHGIPAATYLTRHRKGYTVDPTSYRALQITWKDPAA